MAQEQKLGQSGKTRNCGMSPLAQAMAAVTPATAIDLRAAYGEENAAMLGVGGGDLHHPLAQEVDNDK